MIKIAKTKFEVHDLIKNRWSPRAFLDKKIPEEILFSLFEAASWAASARNEQPWRFICGIKGNGDNYNRIYKTLTPGNQRWAISAPVLGIGIAKTHFVHNNLLNPHSIYDLGQAVATMFIHAISKNIYLHEMGGFDKEAVIAEFKIPEGYIPIVAFAIGYLGISANLPDDLREQEEKERSRKDLNEILFLNDFIP
jgi:nitroreductase